MKSDTFAHQKYTRYAKYTKYTKNTKYELCNFIICFEHFRTKEGFAEMCFGIVGVFYIIN